MEKIRNKDRLVWVFLIASFLGAVIEMLYCHHLDGVWMNRSSLLYGTCSIVWGLGAVLLTVFLRRLKNGPVFLVFAAGFFIGGSYEYLCSIITEWLFGTVFWDYSDMPLNIGGRTNVPYCVAWGILAVVWIKILYPPIERNIEKIPQLTGVCLARLAVIFLLCDGILTGSAMIRYADRQVEPAPGNIIEAFLDNVYDDVRMENRWPNMRLRI